jgi:alkylhydroperoxidase family enzyme
MTVIRALKTEELDAAQLATLKFAIRGRSPGALSRTFLHSPGSLLSFEAMVGGLLSGLSISGPLQEILILRCAQLLNNDYIWTQHVPDALAKGVNERAIASLSNWRASEYFSAEEREALALCDQVAATGHAEPEVIRQLQESVGTEATVECVTTVAFYRMLAGIITSFGLEVEESHLRYLSERTT